MDNKELKPGTTLYLPVFNDGALFMAGDGHGMQGDGGGLYHRAGDRAVGTFRLTVRKDMELAFRSRKMRRTLCRSGWMRISTTPRKQAVREMVKHVCKRTNLSRNQAYMLCSLAGNLRVTQLVDGNKGVHMMLAEVASLAVIGLTR